MTKFKKATGLVIALVMALTFMAQPLVVLADTYGDPADGYTQDAYEHLQGELGEDPQRERDVLDDFFDLLFMVFPDVTRFATLTEDARELALYDFDHFANMLLSVTPTRHMLYRVFGLTMEDYLDVLRQLTYEMRPIPSFTAMMMGEGRWDEEPTDTLMIAADYMMSLLLFFVFDFGGFGHFSPLDISVVEQFFITSYILQSDEYALEATRQEFAEAGLDPERSLDAMYRFHQVHYEIYNTPSVLWFYQVDPVEFDFDVDLLETVGTMNADNITTSILEPGKVAYIHIASFMNNMAIDIDILFPFYEEIQDFEHLIIDVRGNGGGFAGYFPALVVSMLISENISFTYPEFFVAHEMTAALFENPMSLASANLYGIFPAAQFVQDQNMHLFNREDLAILDYVAVWNVEYTPSEYAIPFGGEIWLLVDEGSMSASVMAAQIAVNTGFATVVGEPTSRVTGVVYTFAALPNTGVLFRVDLGYTTDQYGRSIEEFGVIPQILNFPGMDALETVLAVINEADPAPADLEINEDVSDEDSPVRYIDGVEFVRLRYVADAFSAQVTWDGVTQSVLVTAADGSYFVVVVSEYGVINYNGRVYVPVENVMEVLADLLV